MMESAAEPVIDPRMPIVDAHHHLRDRPHERHLFAECLADFESGHNIVASVAVECGDMYRSEGPEELRPLGEADFIAAIAQRFARGRPGAAAGCAGIVSFADLCLGTQLPAVLDALRAATGGRLRGIRNPVAFHPSAALRKTRTGPEGRLTDARFRAGVALLGTQNLSLDAWVYHTQLPDLAALAAACPDTTIVVDHLGGPLGTGPFAGRREEVFAAWRRDLAALARCENVVCKVGGLGMPIMGFGFDTRSARPSSAELAAAWHPYVETAIDLFGPQRCMFESNFPPDGASCSYRVLWNAMKRIAMPFTDAEKAALFRGTAARVYRLPIAGATPAPRA